jgi:hypothetical protein
VRKLRKAGKTASWAACLCKASVYRALYEQQHNRIALGVDDWARAKVALRGIFRRRLFYRDWSVL